MASTPAQGEAQAWAEQRVVLGPASLHGSAWGTVSLGLVGALRRRTERSDDAEQMAAARAAVQDAGSKGGDRADCLRRLVHQERA